MLIGGLQKFTALDYPGKIAATIFTVGCNFRCPFCHNPEIVNMDGTGVELIDEKEVLEFLKGRIGELDGVCITGGEPTLQKDLLEFIGKIKDMGFLVKIDTNGANFNAVEELVRSNMVNYFAMDIKTSFDKYHLVGATEEGVENVKKSISLIASSGAALELRTTMAPGIVAPEDFDGIIESINAISPEIFLRLYRYSVQGFRPQKCLDEKFEETAPYDDKILEEIALKLRKYCPTVEVVK